MNITEYLYYAWPFVAFHLLTNTLLVNIYRTKYKGRIFVVPPMKDIKKRLLGLSTILINISLIALSPFTPLITDSYLFIAGLLLYPVAYIFYLTAMLTYANAPEGQPVTGGVYKLSRHPMQVFTMIIFLAVGFMTSSAIYIVLSSLTLITMYPTLVAQEKYCVGRYGDSYAEYVKQSPRYLLFI